jgi:subtilisin family serine protease
LRLRWLLLLVITPLCLSSLATGSAILYAQDATPEAIPEASQQVQVSPYLAVQVADGSKDVAILILLKEQPDIAALSASAAHASSQDSGTNATTTWGAEQRTARATYLYHALTSQALQSQADLRAWLDDQGIPYHAHYIINMIRVTGDAALVETLRRRPDVARLDADPQVDELHLEANQVAANQVAATVGATVGGWARILSLPEAAASPNTPYGIAATHAPAVWAMGYTGQGITVASQDTGVQWDHPALREHYRGVKGNTVDHTYNWLDAISDGGDFDPCAGMDAPCDDFGHGTHTVGTMVGETATITYGVAPGAQWMGCRNMRNGVGSPETYTTCFEFFLAPYPPDGDPFTDGRPELAPNIINNSWGCPTTEGCDKDSLREVVETLRAAGIMVVASAGNNGGDGCSSVVDPIAIYDGTFTVGAYDANGDLASFSSRGPVIVDGSRRLKPDLAAPGVNILSTYRFSTSTSLSGTSMAAPHVAGAVALLWSAAPWLVGDVDLTEQVLLKSATPVYSAICGDDAAKVSPNPGFGYGQLDAEAAVKLALQPWSVTVAVTDNVGAPVTGAAVTLVDGRTGYTYTAVTDVSGTVAISPVLAGEYELHVQEGTGIVETKPVQLVNDGSSEPKTTRIDVLYKRIEQLFLPGILSDAR